MSGLKSNSKKNRIIKAILVSGFLLGLVSTCIYVENKGAEVEEQAEVMAARRARDIEAEEETPTLLGGLTEDGQATGATMEIVNDAILSDVPAADYSYSFDKQLDNAKVVVRQENDDGTNEGAYPVKNTSKSPLYVKGVEGQAIYLDGSYGVELCGIAPLADSYTVSFWMKAEEMYDWSPFLVIGSNLMDTHTTQNYICFNKKTSEDGEDVVPIFNTINVTAGYSCEVRPSLEEKKCINLNEWNYITIRVDGSQISEEDPNKVMGYLYLNSEMIGCSEVCKMDFDARNMKAYLGLNCFDEMFRVCYDEVRVWNRLLDENQITSMYIAYITDGNAG